MHHIPNYKLPLSTPIRSPKPLSSQQTQATARPAAISTAPIFPNVLPAELGMLPVAACPKYQLPISVNFPLLSNMAALAPTFEISDRKEPKYEYLPMKSNRSMYSADILKKAWESARLPWAYAYSVTQRVVFGYLFKSAKFGQRKEERTTQRPLLDGLQIPRNFHTNERARNRLCNSIPNPYKPKRNPPAIYDLLEIQ